MKTYAIRDARTKTTGHIRQDGTRTTYCNKPVGIPNGDFQGLKGWKVCIRCVKAEARDRAAAEAVAAEHAYPLTEWERDLLGSDAVRDAIATETVATLSAPAMCGARRPGWTTGPAIGTNRLPCILDPDHTGDHRNAFGQMWPDHANNEEARTDQLATETTQTPHPIETYYTLYCATHGSYYPCESQRRHDYMHCTLNAEEHAALLAGDVPPWCYSTADENAPGARKRPTAADRAAAEQESRLTAELITEAEATAGTWRGQWIGEQTTASAPGLFALGLEQGALFA
ncbi:hypothetical protein ACIBKZ_09695 [Streptomyces sp. NPDC050421]|uniref:hypothetical protein n=1 Tax=Streptomyces sp. NPDC050421 TaxID=3365613 RepID=UPI0037B7C4E3